MPKCMKLPENKHLKVGIPKFKRKYKKITLNDKTVWENGEIIDSFKSLYLKENDNYIILNLCSGNHIFEALF